VPRLRKVLWPVGLGLGLVAEWVARSGQGLLAGGADLAVGWTFIACGLIGWSRRPQSRVGVLLALTGFAWFAGTFADAQVDVLAALGAVVLTLHRGTLFHAIVGYPSERLSSRLAVVVVSLSYAYAVIVPLARSDVATIVVVVLVLLTTIRGYATATGPDRLARATAIAAAVAVAFPLVGGSTGRLLGAGPDAERAVLWGYQVVLVLIAVGLLVDLLRGRWARTVVTRLVVDLGERAETDTLQARLAHALGDRSLAIAYWLPEANEYVDERGTVWCCPPPGRDGRSR
jgi:hypothetical protein